MNKYDMQIAVWEELDRHKDNWFCGLYFMLGPSIAFLVIIGIDKLIGRILK